MAHPVICIYCKGKFDRDKTPCVQVSNLRWAHKECAEKFQIQKTQNELDYDTLVEYIEKLFGTEYVTARVAKQIKDFRETYNYTYQGMLGTLIYWYEVKQATLDKANGGIGIIPYIYDQAKEYYQTIDRTNNLNAEIYNYKLKYKEIEIFAPRAEEKPIKLFDLGEEDNG